MVNIKLLKLSIIFLLTACLFSAIAYAQEQTPYEFGFNSGYSHAIANKGQSPFWVFSSITNPTQENLALVNKDKGSYLSGYREGYASGKGVKIEKSTFGIDKSTKITPKEKEIYDIGYKNGFNDSKNKYNMRPYWLFYSYPRYHSEDKEIKALVDKVRFRYADYQIGYKIGYNDALGFRTTGSKTIYAGTQDYETEKYNYEISQEITIDYSNMDYFLLGYNTGMKDAKLRKAKDPLSIFSYVKFYNWQYDKKTLELVRKISYDKGKYMDGYRLGYDHGLLKKPEATEETIKDIYKAYILAK